MEFKTRHIGSYSGRPAKLIEITIDVGNTNITEEVTDMYGRVDKELIDSLRSLADELEEHNILIDEYKK